MNFLELKSKTLHLLKEGKCLQAMTLVEAEKAYSLWQLSDPDLDKDEVEFHKNRIEVCADDRLNQILEYQLGARELAFL